jgi:glycosyltransferase involved in cell wall biosynthesis
MIRELSIIIPTFNESDYIPLLLSSLALQSYTGNLEIIIVDGESTDDTVNIVRSFTNQLNDLSVIETKADIGCQRNIGAQHAKYEYFLFLDADVTLPVDLLKDLLKKVDLKDPFIVSVMHVFDDLSLIDQVFFVVGYLLLLILLLFRMPVTNGDFILTSRANFQNIKGFKEGSILGEDVDFGKRSIESGATFKFYFSPKVTGSLRRVRLMGRTNILLLWFPAFLRVVRHGPIYPGQGLDDYPFGHYNNVESSKRLSKK